MSERMLVICGEPVGARMAGPAIRAVELSAALSRAGVPVTLAAPRGEGAAPLPDPVRLVSLDPASLRHALGASVSVLVGASLLTRFPVVARAGIPIAVDLYDPVPLEAAELYRDAPGGVRRAVVAEAAASLRFELRRADLVICASERQRDLWTGALLSDGRLDDICRVVPFGVPSGRPARAAHVLRGAADGIGAEDVVVLWAGGLHDWFDPELAVAAVDRARDKVKNLRLVFLGSTPPNTRLQPHAAAARARARADELGLLGSHVFFREGWVPYQERGACLADADIGISTHLDTSESRYAWRTRLLDYVWAGLPVACTGGDALGDLMAERGAAISARPGDVEGLADALCLLSRPGKARDRAAAAASALADELRWDRVVQPLADWARAPVRTSDGVARAPRLALWRMYAAKASQVLRDEGVAGLQRRRARFSDRGR